MNRRRMLAVLASAPLFSNFLSAACDAETRNEPRTESQAMRVIEESITKIREEIKSQGWDLKLDRPLTIWTRTTEQLGMVVSLTNSSLDAETDLETSHYIWSRKAPAPTIYSSPKTSSTESGG